MAAEARHRAIAVEGEHGDHAALALRMKPAEALNVGIARGVRHYFEKEAGRRGENHVSLGQGWKAATPAAWAFVLCAGRRSVVAFLGKQRAPAASPQARPTADQTRPGRPRRVLGIAHTQLCDVDVAVVIAEEVACRATLGRTDVRRGDFGRGEIPVVEPCPAESMA